MFGNNQLCYTLSRLYGKIVVGKTYPNHPYFATVIRINSSTGIQNGNSFFGRQATSRTNLSFVPKRQFYKKTRFYYGAFQRFQGGRFLHKRPKIHPRRSKSLVGG